MPNQINCPFCSTQIDATAYFCPNCGKKIREKPLGIDAKSQILLYLVSLLLPPLFIGRTIRYMRSTDPKSRLVGMISLFMTIVAIVVISWITVSFMQKLNSQINEVVNKEQYFGY